MVSASEALTLPGSISESSAKQLPASVEVLMRTTYDLLQDCILFAIEKRSAADFIAWRSASFAQYSNAVLELPALVRFAVPAHVVERLNREFFCELEADIRDKGLAAFGSAVRDQAMFTAWTLRKISELLSQMPAPGNDLSGEKTEEVSKMFGEFISHAIWTRFHLHCLLTSLRVNKALYPEPLEAILEGLRPAVNAYALARRILDVLVPLQEPPVEPVEWDDEDRCLLAEATRDMLGEAC